MPDLSQSVFSVGRILCARVRLAVCAMLLGVAAHAAEPPGVPAIKLPPGFTIALFAEVPNARQMALGTNTLFVGSRQAGIVHAIPLAGGKPGKPLVIARGLEMPVGVAFRDGDLYVSAVSKIVRLRNIEANLVRPPRPETVVDDYPTERAHGWKFIAFGPDGKLYIPVGAPCNICAPDPDRFATITRFDPTTRVREVVARGVRNTVGFDWQPGTRELWFTDNGRDWLGDDAPPDELNRLTKTGAHFGYPHCHGGKIPDPEFGKPCRDFTAPVQNLGAHVAALGMRFYGGTQFPEKYRGAIFVAEHGSWNRSDKAGYKVSVVRLKNQRAVAYEDFATGWVNGETVTGRPADVLVMPDGSLLVSDDFAGRIYRIAYRAHRDHGA
jgi:glucose/arabinose dehydrogenase